MALSALLLLHGGLALRGAWTDSQTFDEGVHLAAGVTYWHTGDFRLNPEHPVLWKLLMAAPVLLWQPSVNLQDPAWAAYQEWDFASRFLHDNRVPALTMLRTGRVVTVLASVTLIGLVFLLGRRVFNARVGILAAGILALDPIVLAHGHYITTDTAVTAGMVFTLWSLHRLAERATRWRILVLVLAVLLTISVKYSGLIVFVMVPLMVWWLHRRGRIAVSGRRIVGWLVGATVVWLFVLYRFHIMPYNQDPRVAEIFRLRSELVTSQQVAAQPSLIQSLIESTDEGKPLKKMIDAAGNIPLPFYWYWRGVAAVTSHAYWGHHAWFLGQTSERGWSWYFPVAAAIKLPAPTFILLVGAGVLALWFVARKRVTGLNAWIILPLLVYGAGTLFSKLNLGIRHILPLLPLMSLGISVVWLQAWPMWNRLRRAILTICCALLCVTAALTSPHELSAFSWLVGGAHQGHRYLLDSNLDWGQDLLRLRDALPPLGTTRVALAYAGTANPKDYGVFLPRIEPDPHATPRDFEYLVISIGKFMGESGKYHWLRNYPVASRIGNSLVLYDLRAPPTRQ